MERISDEIIAKSLIGITDERVYNAPGISVATIDIYPALDTQLTADRAELEKVVAEKDAKIAELETESAARLELVRRLTKRCEELLSKYIPQEE